jgi:S-adenosylmethionine/arginine decarboxylase-like enzyme
MSGINGLHLMIDGRVSDGAVLSQWRLEGLVKGLARSLRAAGRLQFERSQDGDVTSGFCAVPTGHVFVHAWPYKRAFMVDVFFHEVFDAVEAQDVVRKSLSPIRMRVQSLARSPDADPDMPDPGRPVLRLVRSP